MDDEILLDQFQSCTLTADEWHHRQHVKVAYLLLCRYPLGEAITGMRAGLHALNNTHNVPDLPNRGYHETLTQAWMRLVHHTLQEHGPAATADAFLDQHSHLLDKHALFHFYSKDRLSSSEAKQSFLAPDLAELP
jgi:hypothetical protein